MTFGGARTFSPLILFFFFCINVHVAARKTLVLDLEYDCSRLLSVIAGGNSKISFREYKLLAEHYEFGVVTDETIQGFRDTFDELAGRYCHHFLKGRRNVIDICDNVTIPYISTPRSVEEEVFQFKICERTMLVMPSTPTPSSIPSWEPSLLPSRNPSSFPSRKPTSFPSEMPSFFPSRIRVPSSHPSSHPSESPSLSPPPESQSQPPSKTPSQAPSSNPTKTSSPSFGPTQSSSPSDNPEIRIAVGFIAVFFAAVGTCMVCAGHYICCRYAMCYRRVRLDDDDGDGDNDDPVEVQVVGHTFPIPRLPLSDEYNEFAVEGIDDPNIKNNNDNDNDQTYDPITTREFQPEAVTAGGGGVGGDSSGGNCEGNRNVGAFLVPSPPLDGQDVLSIEGGIS